MSEAEIYENLTPIFHDVLDDDSLVLTPGLSAKDVDTWDSLTHIRLIISIEKALNVTFTTSEIGKLKQVSDLVTLIQGRK